MIEWMLLCSLHVCVMHARVHIYARVHVCVHVYVCTMHFGDKISL